MPMFKLRPFFPAAILLGVIFSLLLLYTTFLVRPQYIQSIPGVILAPKPSPTIQPFTLPPLNPETKEEASSNTAEEAIEAISVASAVPTFAPFSNDQNKAWEFNTTRDARNYGLTASQCETSFPGLFNEIDLSIEYRQTIGNITASDLEISWWNQGLVRALLFDQQLYILEEKVTQSESSEYDNPRALAILHALHRAIITSPTPLPDIEFTFSVSDMADPTHLQRPIWVLSKTAEEREKWLMSDFGYWSWPLGLVGGYEEIRREIRDQEIDFELKRKQVVWRGAVKTNDIRKDLLKVTRGKSWADVKNVRWKNAGGVQGGDEGKTISIPEHCGYQFVLQTEGHSYSGRGKYLQNCNSVVIMHKRTWIETQHALLVSSGPSQNFIEVENDFSDLEARVLELLKDQEKARAIARNGVATFRDRYLTAAAQACYWRRLVRGWAEVSFRPVGWGFGDDGEKVIRGVPFETFV